MMSCSYPPHFMMEDKNTALREALEAAKIKLEKYGEEQRSTHPLHHNEYVGGMEYTQLMEMIDRALEPNANT